MEGTVGDKVVDERSIGLQKLQSAVMPFQSQFALSLELTKFLPLGPIINAGGEALLNIARELRRSGSDIVVEEDLATVFGRNRIEPHFASSFKTAVHSSEAHQISNYLDIILEAGAGPTVRRSLTDRARFSTIVQLSLLEFTHITHTLANGLSWALEKRLEGRSSGLPGLTVDYDGLAGTLITCGDQTSGYRWHLLLEAVENTIPFACCRDDHSFRGINDVIFLGLLDLLPAVQYLPEDRIISIKCKKGISTIVVWAHHVLGLTVEVGDGTTANKIFGQGSIHIIIEVSNESYITLLDASDTEELYLAEDNSEGPILTGTSYSPLLGIGVRYLRFYLGDLTDTEVHELATYVLYSTVQSCPDSCTTRSVGGRIQEAVQIIFDDAHDDYKSHFPKISSAIQQEEPSFHSDVWIGTWVRKHRIDKEEKDMRKIRSSLEVAIRHLQIVAILLCRVSAMHDCHELPISIEGIQNLGGPDVLHFMRLRTACWTEHDSVFENWCKIMLCDRMRAQHLEPFARRASAISARGWTVLAGTIGAADPSDYSICTVAIVRGVPSRRGERKHWIVDGTVSNLGNFEDFRVVELPGSRSTLRCLEQVSGPKQFVAVRGSGFEIVQVYKRLNQKDNKYETVRLGFRQMLGACSKARRFEPCGHAHSDNQTVDLPVGNAADVTFQGMTTFAARVKYLNMGSSQEEFQSRMFGLTAGVSAARWLLLCTIHECRQHPNGRVHIYLRGQDCCYRCTVEQAGSNSVVVL